MALRPRVSESLTLAPEPGSTAGMGEVTVSGLLES